MKNDTVITGMGVVSSIGHDVDTFWSHLLQGTRNIQPFPVTPDSTVWWSPVDKSFQLHQWIDDPKRIRQSDRFSQFTLAATKQALWQARLANPPNTRTAIIVGSSMGGVPTLLEAETHRLQREDSVVPSRLMAMVIPNMAASQVAMQWNLHGPQITLAAACASSIDAIGWANRLIANDEVDVVIAGGVETLLTPLVTASLSRARALSHNPDATRASRPFDRDRDGFVMGEGAGIVVLESQSHAQARGARTLGRVLGYHSLADGYHVTSPDPSGQWEALAMQGAIDNAGLSADVVDAVIAHGTSTPIGDKVEILAMRQVYGDRQVAVTSIKGHIGHTMASSGVMSVIAGLQGMAEGQLPMTAGTHHLDQEATFDLIMKTPRRLSLHTIQVNAFGFGGQNASVILGSP